MKRGDLTPLFIKSNSKNAHAANKCIAKMQADGSRVSTVVTLFSHISSLTLSI
jgi:hypothetical protein